MKQKIRDRTRFIVKGRFVFLTEAYIQENHIQFTPFQSSQLRGKLPRGIYWLQIVDRGMIQWNWLLLNSYLVHGIDSTEHQALLDEYLATLPKASERKHP